MRTKLTYKRPDAARNARPKKLLITHGGNSRALRFADLDLRSKAGREYRARVAALVAHVGGDPSAPQTRLIDMAARLHLIAQLAWDELSRTGAFRDGEPRPALGAYRSAIADERSVLSMLGLQRKSREVPDLRDYIAEKAKRLPLRIKGADVEDAEEVSE